MTYFNICPDLYGQMLDRLSNIALTERLGFQEDLLFYNDDQWLCDTAVIEQVTARKGAWEVGLLFAHHKSPLKFLFRRITSHACPRRARQMAFYMRRQAAKDQRGTLLISIESFDIPVN